MSADPLSVDCRLLADVRQALPFLPMTFPRYRPMLLELGPNSPVLAIGAFHDNQPAGLVLAELYDDTPEAEVHSVFVQAGWRSRGVATALMRHLERELRLRGAEQILAVYTTGKESTPALERVLDRCGYGPVEPRLYLFQASPECVPQLLQSRWIRRDPLPAGFTFFPWDELTAEEREQIERDIEADVVPAHVSPFVDPESYEPAYSIGLRHEGRVIGWVVAHRNEDRVVRFTALHVRPKTPAVGIGVRLAAEAVHRFITTEAVPSGSSATWGSLADSPFAEFIHRRIVRNLSGMSATLSVQRVRDLTNQPNGGDA